MDLATWNNTRLIKADMVAEIRKLKNEAGVDMVIMGSGTIIAQLAQARLIDEYQMVMIPVVLGQGRTMFEDLEEKQRFKLTSWRTFNNGNVLLIMHPW
jgi:dihydrofolate reductase